MSVNGWAIRILAAVASVELVNSSIIAADAVPPDSRVTFESSQGVEVHATLTSLGRLNVAFEVSGAGAELQMSEVLSDFRVLTRAQSIYTGRAVISGMINTGSATLCQATLQEPWPLDASMPQPGAAPDLTDGFIALVHTWSKLYRILPEYKLAVSDIQGFLFDLRHWAERSELSLPPGIAHGNARFGSEVEQVIRPATDCLNTLFQKFERVAAMIEPELAPAHGIWAKRQLHPLLLCSPFMHRIYRKPLGYAGDYQMVHMILRDPHEGHGLFAQLLNRWFLSQLPAEAHRNRVQMLTQYLREETLRTRVQGRRARVYNLGCGPAGEIAAFLDQHDLSDWADFTLLDFNEETLAFVRNTLASVRSRHHRVTGLEFIKKSVVQVLKGTKRTSDQEFDFIYCAGLFDYLPDRACRQLMDMFHEMLAPGGLLLVTNVDPMNPIQRIMGYIFEWHLIYRDAAHLDQLIPSAADPGLCRVRADASGCNIFLEIRKPALRA